MTTSTEANAKPFNFNNLLQRLNLSIQRSASALDTNKTINQTEAAIATLNNIIGPPNAQDKIMTAITDALRSDTMKKDEIALADDADGNMKKLKDNLMTMHECASMPDCVTADDPNCCTPASPKQAKFIQARNQALEAWGNLDEDIREENKEALEFMKLIAGTTTYYPIGHPLHVPTPASDVTIETIRKEEKNVTEKVVVEDSGSNVLLIAICVASGVIVLGVLVLVGMSMGGKTGAGTGAGATEEWGEEGYGEEQW